MGKTTRTTSMSSDTNMSEKQQLTNKNYFIINTVFITAHKYALCNINS